MSTQLQTRAAPSQPRTRGKRVKSNLLLCCRDPLYLLPPHTLCCNSNFSMELLQVATTFLPREALGMEEPTVSAGDPARAKPAKPSKAAPKAKSCPTTSARPGCGHLPYPLLHNTRSQQPLVLVAPRFRALLGTYFAAHIIKHFIQHSKTSLKAKWV